MRLSGLVHGVDIVMPRAASMGHYPRYCARIAAARVQRVARSEKVRATADTQSSNHQANAKRLYVVLDIATSGKSAARLAWQAQHKTWPVPTRSVDNIPTVSATLIVKEAA